MRVRIAVAVTASSNKAFDPVSATQRTVSGIGATLFSVTLAKKAVMNQGRPRARCPTLS